MRIHSTYSTVRSNISEIFVQYIQYEGLIAGSPCVNVRYHQVSTSLTINYGHGCARLKINVLGLNSINEWIDTKAGLMTG